MSTLSGVSSKGEKGKSKFQSLDINSIYHKTNKGESSEQQASKNTVPRRHGMQNLGKVPSTRRAPVNLPSLKSEHCGSDPTVSIVPTGGTGWGSKPSDTPSITPTTCVTTTSGATPVTNAPAVVGTAPAQQPNITPVPPLQQSTKPASVASAGGDKTWSSVMVGGGESGGPLNTGGGTGPSFLAHQSPQFQAEFPSLPGEGGVLDPPSPHSGEGGYGPGPSLRPQTEGSWAQGGGYQASPNPAPSNRTFPSPPPVSTTNNVPQYKGVIPSFMLNRASTGGNGFPSMFPGNFQNSCRPPKLSNAPGNRYSAVSRSLSDSDDVIGRPIIREEDLNRMDEISRDSGWATQDDIDYNQKLAFSDDEGNGNGDDKDAKDKLSSAVLREEDNDTEKGRSDKVHEKANQGWQERSPSSPQPEFRHSQQNAARELDMDDVWKEKRRQQSEQVAAVAEKAKQRKEEEEKRFEETRFKSENDKNKKEDVEVESVDKKEQGDTFKHLTQIETRNLNRNESQQSYNRFHTPLPPRFQKQQQYNTRQQLQQNLSESRWIGQHYQGNKQRIGGENDERREKEDESSRRERTVPDTSDRYRSLGSRHDRDYDSNKRSSGCEKKFDSHRNHSQHDFSKESKDFDNRMRVKEEMEWEGKRSDNSAWEEVHNFENTLTSGRRDVKKSNESYTKSHPSVFDDGEWRDHADTRDRLSRPDSRDSKISRDSHSSREEPRPVSEKINNEYSWADNDFEKEIHEEKQRRKDNFKEDRRENQAHARREGHVPGPITKEKMEAYEHKQIMAEVFKAEKKELVSSCHDNRGEEDSWKKADPSDAEERLQAQQASKTASQQGVLLSLHSSQKLVVTGSSSLVGSCLGDENTGKGSKDEGGLLDKKIPGQGGSIKEKGVGSRGANRNARGGMRQNTYNNSNFGLFYRSSNNWNSRDSAPRRGHIKSGKPWNASDSEGGSGDEISISTESGKEDKKVDKKQASRSPKTNEKNKEKDDRCREPKKHDSSGKASDSGNTTRKGTSGHLQGGQVLSGTGGQMSGSSDGAAGKEGFLPRGEPSRRGRGGYRTPSGRGPVGAHYGPPGSKPAFTATLPLNRDEDADSSSEDKKGLVITDKKDHHRKGEIDSSWPHKGKTGRPKREHDEWVTTSEGSDSEAKGKSRHPKKSLHRIGGGEKRNILNASHVNGQPRSDESKMDEKSRVTKDEDNLSHFVNHSDTFSSNNGFQAVRSKKSGKESRPLNKEDLKHVRGKEKSKSVLLSGGNGGKPSIQGKSFPREWNNKPPRMQRQLILQQQQQLQSHKPDAVSDMNKLNQNIPIFPLRDVSCPTPAPPPSVNAWDKPITATLRTTPSPTCNLHHMTPISGSQEKNVIDLNDRGPSGTNSQTSSPSTEKAIAKIGREVVEKSYLDGTTPPVQTIVFENTNLKAPSEVALKAKYPLKGQRIEKGRDRKLDGELDDMTLGGFKPGTEMKPGETKNQEPVQIPLSFNKSEDNADMKLDFQFESDLSHLTDEKPNINQSIHQVLVQSSAADLNQKIASVKKVWETPGSMMENQHHDEVSTSSSSFTPNFASAVESPLDHSHQMAPDESAFSSDVYSSGPKLQGTQAFANSGGNIMKTESSNVNSKVKPQQSQAIISSAIGTHSGQSLSSPPPFNQQGHYSYQAPYNNMPAIPSPPAVLINPSAAGGSQQVPPAHQAEPPLYHSFPIGGPTMMSSGATRTGFSQYPYGLGQGIGNTSGYSQGNIYMQPTPPPNPTEVFPPISQYRLQPSVTAYGPSQQLNSSSPTVLITSTASSLMSASVKSSAQPPPLGAIGSKAGYQSSAHPSQVQLSYIPYDHSMSFLQSSPIVQRHAGNNIVPAIQPTSSFYSNATGGQTGLFQPSSSILAGNTVSQPGALHNATAFGIQGFGSQSAVTAPSQPASNSNVGVQSFSSQMGHFRAQLPGGSSPYLKPSSNPGPHPSDPSKSPVTSQELVNSVFSGGAGGQIPSPKSRCGNANGAGGKQSQTSQQPSPTQPPHKFSYQTQPNLVMGNSGNRGQAGQGVRGGSSNGSALLNSGVRAYPNPIQRPIVNYQGTIQQQGRRVPPRNQPTTQQHLKISSQFYQHQAASVKLEVEPKEEDKLVEVTNSGNKGDKKEEQRNSVE